MAATMGTPPGGTAGTTESKPEATKAVGSSRDKPDAASSATIESNRPSAEKIIETGPQMTGTATPSGGTAAASATGRGSAANHGDPTGFGGVTEPNPASPTATQQDARPDSGTTSTATIDSSSRTSTGPKAGRSDTERLMEAAGALGDGAARSTNRNPDAADRPAHRARQQGRQDVGTAQTMLADHPVATALIALGVGLLLGSMLGGQSRK